MKVKAYICSTDALYHIPHDRGGVTIFFSEESLLENKPCIGVDQEHGCRVCEIMIEVPDYKQGVFMPLKKGGSKKPTIKKPVKKKPGY